jgi:uncharacterized protein YjdB
MRLTRPLGPASRLAGPLQSRSATLRAVMILLPIASCAFGQNLSIANYTPVSQQTVQGILTVTYTADLVNTGAALGAVTATVSSLSTSSVQIEAGQNTLQFAPVPANSQVTSSNTFTLLLPGGLPADFSQLQWAFQAAGILLPANLTIAPGGSATLPVNLGSPAPAGGVYISLATSNPSIATVSPSTVFIAPGTSAPRAAPAVSGSNAGSATVSASATGYPTASTQLQVTPGGTTSTTMSFWPGSLTVSANTTQNLTLNLSSAAASPVTVNLSSSNTNVVTVPSTITIPAGAGSAPVALTAIAAGSVTITASALNAGSATAGVTVTQRASTGIVLPGNMSVAAGSSVNFPVALGAAAPSGGVYVTLSSTNSSVAAISPQAVFIPEGMTTPARSAIALTAYTAGTVTITASAAGYPDASVQVQVTGAGPSQSITMSLSPGTLTINGSAAQNLTLSLSTAAASALTVNLSSSNPSVATVPATATLPAGATSLQVPVTGLAAGSVTIMASASGLASASATVTVTGPPAGGILLPANVTVSTGNTSNFPVTLGSPAAAGGVYLTLTSSDPSIAVISPSTLLIPAGATSPRAQATVSGISAGSTTITASAFGYPSASAPVQVAGGSTTPPPTLSFSPGNLTISGGTTGNLALDLSAPMSTGLAVNLSSSNPAVATVPATVTFGAGGTSISVPVTGISAGSANITASAPGISGTNASVTVTNISSGAISLPASLTVGVNQSAAVQVTLSAAAPASGVTVSLASNNTATATVTPAIFIAAGATSAQTPAQISGVGAGSAVITASAPGFTSANTQVQVTSVAGGSFLSPVGGITLNAGSTQDLTLNLSPPPATGVTVTLTSSAPSVATVPATLSTTAGSGTVSIPVTAVAPGSVTITAVTPGFGTATDSVTVPSLSGVSITWYGACWANLTINGYTGNYQAIDFSLTTPSPVVLNGSLFFTANCDPSQGVDNLNDNGALTGSTHMIQGFTHYPGVIPSSAVYWIGNATSVNGQCPAGSLCSGCVSYTSATPSCSTLP